MNAGADDATNQIIQQTADRQRRFTAAQSSGPAGPPFALVNDPRLQPPPLAAGPAADLIHPPTVTGVNTLQSPHLSDGDTSDRPTASAGAGPGSVGASIAEAVGRAAGSGTAAGVGASIAEAVGRAAGSGAVKPGAVETTGAVELSGTSGMAAEATIIPAPVPIVPTVYPQEPGGAVIVYNHITINSIELKEFNSKLDEVIRLLRGSNEISGEGRDQLIAEIKAGRALLESPKLDPKLSSTSLTREEER
jgi:hypothetical protein